MAEERLNIVVTERGTRSVRRNLQGVGDGAEQAQGALTLLRRALGALVGGALLSGLIQLADSFTNIQNRLKTVTSSTQELTAVTNALFGVSNRTRTSFEDTAAVYARLRSATESLGLSQQETIQFTESLSQATILSGASSEEASRALIQLAQGLGTGTLRAEEFNSIMEQAPGILDVIAKSLGTTRGGLRELLLQGRLTADVIIKAFQESREELGTRFAKSTITVGQSLTVLRNNVTRFIGELNQANGITAILSNALVFLGENIGTVVRVVTALAFTIGTVYAAGAVNKAIAATRAFTIALATNPFGAIAVGITALVALLVSFSDQIRVSGESAATIADFFVAAFEEIQVAARALLAFFAPQIRAIFVLFESTFGEVDLSFSGVITSIASGLDFLVNAFRSLPILILTALVGLPNALGELFVNAFNGIAGIINESLGGITSAINSVLNFAGVDGIDAPQIQQIENSFAGAGAKLGEALGGAMQGSFSGFSEATERIFVAAEERANERLQRTQEQEAQQARAAAALATPGTRTARPSSASTGQTRRGFQFGDAIRQLEQQRVLLGLNAREQERVNVQFSIANRLRRDLTSAESEALDNKVQELQLARDSEAIQQTLNRLSEESVILTAESNVQRAQLATTLQLEDQIKRQLTDAERQAVEAQVAQNEALRVQSQILGDIRGPQEEFAETQSALMALLDSGKISIQEYNIALRDSRLAALEAGTSIEDGFARGLLRIQQNVTDLASVVDGALGNAFRSAEDAFVNFVQTGKLDFSGLVDSLIADIARLAFRQAVGGLFGGGGGGGLGGIIGGLFGGAGGGGGLLGSLGGLIGFQNGGDFTVGGRGGRDSNILSVNGSPVARVSRGENVSVSPQGGGGNQRPIVVNFNFPPGTDSESFQRSQGQIMARTQQALSRASTRNN